MSQLFDTYDKTYREIVQSSIDFSGLPHSFFLQAKADMLRNVIDARFNGAASLSALDVGCGTGEFHPYVRGLFGKLVGVDVSKACIAQARQANSDVAYETSLEGSDLPFPDRSFDLTMINCVMHHVQPDQWFFFVREMRRVTRPGGAICVIEHNPFNPLTRLAVARCEFDRDAVLLRAGRTERLLDGAGLLAVETRYFLMLPFATPLARRIERWFSRMPFGAQYLTAATV
jgi:ubiquinone/menaquinone biosynthesis C-methylase UbiE